jgi:hypothetical protein
MRARFTTRPRLLTATLAIATTAVVGCGGGGAPTRDELVSKFKSSADVDDDALAQCFVDTALDEFGEDKSAQLEEAIGANSEGDVDDALGAGAAETITEMIVACSLDPSGEAAVEQTTPDTATGGETTVESTTDTTAGADTTVSAAPPSESLGSRDEPLAVGTTAPVGGGFSVSFTDYVADAGAAISAENEFNEPAGDGKVYVTATMTATFDGGEGLDKATFLGAGPTLSAVGTSGTVYNSYDCVAVTPNMFDSFVDVFAGSSLSGTVCFIVDAADANGLVVYTDGYDADLNTLTAYFATS